MNTVTAGARWLLSKTDMPYAAEWRSLRSRSRRCNLLLEGPEEDTDAVLALLKPHLREPILWQRRGAPLELTDGKSDTLILQDVAALGPVEQRRLIAWLDENRGGLDILVHGLTGNDLEDHTTHAAWLGDAARLNLEVFTG